VSPEWLVEHGDDVLVADVRWYLDGRSGRAAHEAGHVPGAVFVDVDTDLAAPPSPEVGRHPMPTPEAFAAAMGRLGIGDDSTVVAYDDTGGATAARLVWMLRVLGRPATLLYGGVAGWPGELEEGPVEPVPATFTPRPWPEELLADADAVATTDGVVVDARAPERYRGEVEPVDARAGHVPGAVNVPHAGNLGPDGRWLAPEALATRFPDTDGEVIVYCGSGVTACSDLLALEVAGRPPGRLYAGSWSQWAADPERPLGKGMAQ
jgi:thiosulfate/3-mercaptopyruvate sulfurtransferase